ncbi:hypothetical protein ACFQ4O_04880 [Methylopila musalis]|uniref:Ribbon-helix-helix protein CopG domain-containing protein n=1 Tax=Methylopila musalis TaxID=1134781 RepID=A0ABW3Z566_9HYPH
MKNVTITMDEDVLAWVRIEAAKRGESVSRFLGETIAAQRAAAGRDQRDEERAALERFLSGPGFPGAGAAWPGREELYADRKSDLLRRHEHPDLRSRSEGD